MEKWILCCHGTNMPETNAIKMILDLIEIPETGAMRKKKKLIKIAYDVDELEDLQFRRTIEHARK